MSAPQACFKIKTDWTTDTDVLSATPDITQIIMLPYKQLWRFKPSHTGEYWVSLNKAAGEEKTIFIWFRWTPTHVFTFQIICLNHLFGNEVKVNQSTRVCYVLINREDEVLSVAAGAATEEHVAAAQWLRCGDSAVCEWIKRPMHCLDYHINGTCIVLRMPKAIHYPSNSYLIPWQYR